VPEVLVSLADDYYELGQIDKSIFYLQRALQQKGRPDADILNQLGICYGEKGDWARQEKAYREAFAADPHDPAPLFNLALSQFRRKQFSQAADTIQTALEREGKGPYFVLAAQIYQKLNRHQDVNSALKEAFEHFDPLPTLDDWELNWYCKAALMAGDEDLIRQVGAEQMRRKRRQATRQSISEDGDEGDLPEILPTLQKR
jgi:tetratricopeptide (TPR) repeat protein